MSSTERIAAIDIGTVTTRLLVADVRDGAISEVHRSVDITHLGEGVSESGRLTEVAMARVKNVLDRYRESVSDLDAQTVVAMATSASRDAENADRFEAIVASAGFQLSIIEGQREAELSFAGATHGRSGEGLLVVDIGGGSTELVSGDASARSSMLAQAISIDVGSRRITEMFMHSDPPSAREISTGREYVREQLSTFFDALEHPVHTAISVAGTATTLAAIDMEMGEYDPDRIEGFVLTSESIAESIDRLSSLPLDQRRLVTGLHPDRAYVIIAGAVIQSEVLALSGLDSTIVSERDILYGMLLDAYRRAS